MVIFSICTYRDILREENDDPNPPHMGIRETVGGGVTYTYTHANALTRAYRHVYTHSYTHTPTGLALPADPEEAVQEVHEPEPRYIAHIAYIPFHTHTAHTHRNARNKQHIHAYTH